VQFASEVERLAAVASSSLDTAGGEYMFGDAVGIAMIHHWRLQA
jgi:hypothetical protein